MKNTKKLSAMALTGLMGFSLLGSPVMAAAPEAGKADSNVYYTTNSNTIDADGKVVMVIPADMHLNKNKLSAKNSFVLKTSDGSTFEKFKGFSAKVSVSSENNGKLKSNSITADYKLRNENTNKENNWGTPATDFISFAYDNVKTKNEVSVVLEAIVDQGNSSVMEAQPAGTRFSDKLTYKVNELKGEGLNYTPVQP